MRRAAIVLAACFGAVAGCRGGVAQEASSGAVTAGPAAAPAAAARDAAPIASEVDVRRAIALLSDARRPTVKRPRRVTIVERQPLPSVRVVQEIDSVADVQLVVDRGPSAGKVPGHDPDTLGPIAKPAIDGKRAEAKACNGLVHRRS